MKKLTFFSLFASIVAFNAHAQFALGVKGGINFNKVYTDAGSLKANIQQSLDTKTGFTGGVFVRVGKKVFLQPEALVSSKGGSIDVVKVGTNIPQTLNFKYTNLDIPVLVGFKIFDRIRIMAGPMASLKLNEDQKLKDALQGYASAGLDNALNQATFGYQAGVGIHLIGFDIDLRKEGSLSQISMLNLNNNAQFSQRATGWQLTIAKKIL